VRYRLSIILERNECRNSRNPSGYLFCALRNEASQHFRDFRKWEKRHQTNRDLSEFEPPERDVARTAKKSVADKELCIDISLYFSKRNNLEIALLHTLMGLRTVDDVATEFGMKQDQVYYERKKLIPMTREHLKGYSNDN
jgi:hypothetical protein